MFRQISLRWSLAIGILLMGALGIALTLYIGETFRNMALDNQRLAYEDIIRLRVDERLESLIKNSRDLGQSVQNNTQFRQDLAKHNTKSLEKYLAQQFHQYFVTAGILKLNSLIALDQDLGYIADAVDEKAAAKRVGGITCARMHERARQREGAARLQTLSETCLHGGYPFVHVLIPIGGLRVVGYLEIITDPTYSMKAIEQAMGLPIKITLMDDRVVYASSNWERADDDGVGITASITVSADSGNEAYRVFVKRDITRYQQQLNNTLHAMTIMAVIVTLLVITALLLFIKRTTLDPINELGDRVKDIRKDSNVLGDKIDIQGNKEVRDLAAGFNEMTNELKTLYDELQNTNKDLKQQVRERERAEIELKISRDHLEELVERRTSDLAIARDAALNASRSKSRFLANMSHELRTPLNAIIGYTEIMIDDAYNANNQDLANDLKKVAGAGEHLLRLIRDILDLSKIEAGKMELVLEDFNVKSLVEEAVSAAMSVIDEGYNKLTVNCPDDIGTMYADANKVRQALLNLLSNAGKFTQNGTIVLDIKRDAGDTESAKIHFSVTDTGIGLSRDEMTRVFQAFTQADTSTTRKYGGTGLGLAISRNYCLMMGGELTVKSEKGEGSTFTIILPVEVKADAKRDEMFDGITNVPNPAALRITREIGKPVNRANERRRRVSLVLIIDDDPSVCELVSRYLITKGYKTVTASGGQEGIKYAREIEPDMILLDVLMSGMDGWEVLTSLKQDSMLKDIPVVMMSIIDDKNMGYALGASDYLIKPIDRDRLFKVVNKCVRRKSLGPVLIIKDDNEARSIMTSMLMDDGWKVIGANNNYIAIDLAQRELPSLIVLDSSTTDFDAEEYINALKHNKGTQSIPVIVTGRGDSEHQLVNADPAVKEALASNSRDDVSLLMDKVFQFIAENVE